MATAEAVGDNSACGAVTVLRQSVIAFLTAAVTDQSSRQIDAAIATLSVCMAARETTMAKSVISSRVILGLYHL